MEIYTVLSVICCIILYFADATPVIRDDDGEEGDIRLSVVQKLKSKLAQISKTRLRRSTMGENKEYLWKDNSIYFKVESSFDREAQSVIKGAIKHWRKAMKGCIKFVRLDRYPGKEAEISKESFNSGPVPHILFTGKYPGQCWSQIGRVDSSAKHTNVIGQQLISLGKGCLEKGTIIHEIGHAVGLWHEQSRRDRDKYIKIIKNNIVPGNRRQFEISYLADSMGYAYDYWSVMHYGPTDFSRNGQPTMKIKRKYRSLRPRIGQRLALSYLDIAKVRAMYQCNTMPSLEKCLKDKSAKGKDYRGKIDYTEKGVMCQPWNKQYPNAILYNKKENGLGNHNYCRNPGGERERPWCYTTLNDDNQSKWQYCDIRYCEK